MSAALETPLEWPRFCYTGPSMFEDCTANGGGAKKNKKSQQSKKRLSSSSNDASSDGETGSIKDEQMVPSVRPKLSPTASAGNTRSEFAFSDLMRKMASKYQEPTATSACHYSAERNLPPLFTAAAAAALNQYLPYPSFAPLFSHLTPALETLAGSRALTALAQAQKRLRDTFEDQVEEPKSKKSRKVDSPLDLTKNSCNEDEVDVLSIDPPSPSNVEQWSVDKVADFVSNVESCREYAQVFQEHCIDGSALLVLNEAHLTRIMGLKLGPAIRLRSAIQELKEITGAHLSD